MSFPAGTFSAFGVASFRPNKSVGLWRRLILIACAVALPIVGAFGCAQFPGTTVDGYASAEVETWHDLDGDGERGQDEPPLPWVTVHMAYEQTLTDSSGRGTVGVFKPGCTRRCWQGESVSVQVPPGYRPTTPASVDLAGPEDIYGFGFQAEAGTELASTPGEPEWAQAFRNRGLGLVALDYDESQDRLELSFGPEGSSDADVFFRDVFDVVHLLEDIEGVSVEYLEITRLPSGRVGVCIMSEVEAWMGKIPPSEIVSTYCQIP